MQTGYTPAFRSAAMPDEIGGLMERKAVEVPFVAGTATPMPSDAGYPGTRVGAAVWDVFKGTTGGHAARAITS